MGVKRFFLFLSILFLTFSLHAQQEYVRHTVQAGETVYSIAQKYNITEQVIVKYNPDVVDGLKAGSILIVPASVTNATEERKSDDFIYHTVVAKETLYALSKQYNCTVEEIISLNPGVENGLKVGETIKIPKPKPKTETEKFDSTKYIYHVVEAKETVFSICRAAGISEEDFLKLNPQVRENGLQIGQTIRLPKEAITAVEELPTDVPKKKEFGLYRILAGDDLVSIAAKYNTTVEVLIDLNPELADGVIVGRYIIVPSKQKGRKGLTKARDTEPLFWYKPKSGVKPKVHFAVLLPLFLDINDSISRNSFDGKTKVHDKSKMGLQFLAGIQTAMDTLVGLGYDVELDIYDTKNDVQTVRNIAKKIDKSVDAIIGPLYSRNVELLADLIKDKPIISPLSKALNNAEKSNLINCVPNLKSEYVEMAAWLNKQDSNVNILFLNTESKANFEAVESIKNYLFASDSLKRDELWVDQSFSQLRNLSSYLSLDKQNILVVVDQDAAFISDLLTKVNNRRDSAVSILGTSKLFDIRTLENRYLNNKRFIALNSDLVNYEDTCTQLFVKKFRAKTATEPNKFAFYGFDTGLYFGELIAAYGVLPDIKEWPRVRGLQKGFDFHNSTISGPQNNFVFKLRIRDFELKEVKQ